MYIQKAGIQSCLSIPFHQCTLQWKEIYLALLAFKLAGKESSSKTYKQMLDKMTFKFVSSLTSIDRKMFLSASRQISVEGYKPTSDIDIKTFSKINQAISESTQLEIFYKNPGKENAVRRIIDPYSMVYRKNSWYLIAFCSLRNSIRTFKVNRIEKVLNTLNRFSIPKDFSADEYLSDSWWIRTGPKTVVSIWFDSEIAPLILEKNIPGTTIKKNKDKSIVLVTSVGGTDEITWWILQYGNHAKVLEPPELQDKIRDILAKSLKHYEKIKSKKLTKSATRKAE